jgi:hypothetical protein
VGWHKPPLSFFQEAIMATINDPLNFDFGFSVVSEDELEVVQRTNEANVNLAQRLEDTDNKAQKIYNAVIPLLTNLKSNPEKDYIYWPNRYEKLEAFEDALYNIMNGDNA